MCGIAGWAIRTEKAPVPKLIEDMTTALAHRGPDGSGSFLTKSANGGFDIALGHRRLAIIDPTGGVQPMFDDSGKIAITYNGEMYNFREVKRELEQSGVRFRTACDTEVLIYAYKKWGPACVERLRGMFAFAIWDAEKDLLFIARDRFGKKPLFLYTTEDALFFASEIKALLAIPDIPRKLDQESVLEYLQYRYVPGPHTLFKGIRKLAPGSYAVWKNGRLTEHSYYTPPDATRRPDPVQPADPVAAFMTKLDEAVEIRMVSDVPFGVFLSGGLDSSTVAALMCRHLSTPVKSFSIGFAEDRYSEAHFGRMVARHLRTDHEEVVVDAHKVLEEIPHLIKLSDAPVTEPGSVMVYLLSVAASRSVKMVLTGEGADEILGGYPKHRFEPYAIYYQFIPQGLHRAIIEPMVSSLPFSFRRHKTLVTNWGIRDPHQRMPRWFGALTTQEIAALTTIPTSHRPLDNRPFAVDPNQSSLRKICYFDQTSVLPDDLLERGDRMTMGASIEARMPFMDHELADLVASLKDDVRIRGGVQKWILREVARQLLPAQIASRPKLGFINPLRVWLQKEMSAFTYDHLTGADSMTRNFYDKKLLTRIIDDHVSGRQDNEKLIWMLLNLELFQRAFRLQ